MDDDLVAQIQMAQLLEAVQAVSRAGILQAPESNELDLQVARQRAYVDACLRHHGYDEALRQEFTSDHRAAPNTPLDAQAAPVGSV